MQKKVKANCPVCGKAFVKKINNQKYCSTKCKNVMKRKAEKVARACGKKVEKKATTKKPVALKEKITLPKKPTAKKVEKPTVHVIKPNDIIAWSKEMGPARIMAYAIRLHDLVITDVVNSVKAAKVAKKSAKK